jgi:predicted Fe-Mo cluster-binding NifX family protein
MKQKALSVFRQPPAKLNCAQSVIYAAQEALGENGPAMDDFKAMGGGRAPEGICGALHAACAAAPEAASALKMQFAAKTGATTCHDLKRVHKVPCEQSVATAAELLQQQIEGDPDDQQRIAIPLAQGQFSSHFGGAKEFVFFDANRKTGRIFRQTTHPAPEHQPGTLPLWLASQKVDAVIANAIGERALMTLASEGIATFFVEEPSTPEAMAKALLEGKLPPVSQENSRCQGHHEDGHSHHDGCDHHH